MKLLPLLDGGWAKRCANSALLTLFLPKAPNEPLRMRQRRPRRRRNLACGWANS
jgi:hypothetical protein